MSDNLANLDSLFSEAIDIASSDERATYLARCCGADLAKRHRLEKLLDAHVRAGNFLESPAVSKATAVDLDVVTEKPGTLIGAYKLLEEIGEGGMGLVFMAEQLQPVRRRVALKILKPGMDTRQVVARFEAERQALAMMDHANIAKVFDAGMTDTGRPYFVMELVHGVSITEYCDQHRLTPRQRLELFATVCQAVQHAHQKGIIHRDLKPSNVLVSLHDTVPVPKVIDFGIAKATGEQLTEKTLFTHFSQIIGTPLYMSPEQAEMNGLGVDTRSDVYALGVMLYELLTGATPFDSETLKKAGYDEMRRIIREEEPPRPSQRVSTLEAAACTTVSARRGMDERRLGPLLRGELDWIVMKALDKDRNRRYESASALAADVNRYLQDEPVEACPPSAWYRARMYVRRHRRLLSVASVIVAVLVVATVVSTWQAALARDAQRQAEAAESRAATEVAIARAVSDFLQADLLGQADDRTELGQEIGGNPSLTVKEALDRASARIGQRFQDQPLVEAAIQATIGEAYYNLDERKRAVTHLERALALRYAYLGPNHPDLLRSMDSLAVTYTWVGRFSDAITLHQQLHEYKRALLGPDHSDTLARLHALGNSYSSAGQWNLSTPILERVLEKRRAVQGPYHPDTLGTMNSLGLDYLFSGRVAESLPVLQDIYEHLKSTTSPSARVFNMMCLANACYKAGELEQSERLHREALDVIAKQPDSMWRRRMIASASGWLARTLLQQDRPVEAEPLIRQAVAFSEKHQPEDQRHFYWVNLLGAVLAAQKRFGEAEPLLLQGYEGMKDREAMLIAGDRFWRLPQACERVVRFYEATGQSEKARLWREKLAIVTKTK